MFKPTFFFKTFIKVSQKNLKMEEKLQTENEKEAFGWFPLEKISKKELNLDITLRCGQAFRWKKIDSLGLWTGIINSTVFELKELSNGEIYFRAFKSSSSSSSSSSSVNLSSLILIESKEELKEKKDCLKDYFRLDICLESLMNHWSKSDDNFDGVRFIGLRLMKQDPLECLFSFICSQNNNISRITKMIDSLCSNYGTFLGSRHSINFYSFPTLLQLKHATEKELRGFGFGYRAKYIVQTCKQLLEKEDENWIYSLKNVDYPTKKNELLKFYGIGRKVADCIALFSLDQFDIVPVDTHIWKIAKKYIPSLKTKSLTDSSYQQIGDFFRKMFGPECGWAHTIMFANELSFFKEKSEYQIENNGKKKRKKSNENKTFSEKEKEEAEEKEKEKEEEKKEKEEEKQNNVRKNIRKRRRKN